VKKFSDFVNEYAAADAPMKHQVMTTEPHGAHSVYVLEDGPKAADRIYEIKDNHEAAAVNMLGSELDSLCRWWVSEKQR
jgi:hypothetical protein